MAEPLTTTFDPPSQCTQDVWWVDDGGFELLGGTFSSCYPPNFTPTSVFYYSPGLYCPDGYSTACTSSGNAGDDTIVTCCPTSYTCQTAPVWEIESTLGCRSAVTGSQTHTVKSTSGTRVNTWGPGAAINAYSVQLRFQASDLGITTSAPTSAADSTTSSPTTISSSTTTSSTTSSSTATSGPSHGGLSTGAKAGISVGVVLGVALTAAIIFLALTIRKGGRNDPSNQRPSGGTNLPELVKQPALGYGSAAPVYGSTAPVYGNAAPPNPGMQGAGHLPRHELGQPHDQSWELPAHR
ncbi:uncharacterized protein BDZ99DRAFT_524823 [Mytilinidion resinicola]|uniref:Mid2 domain-containing protein n=1 Tax=Mytilinidion resinicola TaxID=574789 RepID=A0A6A6YAF8_9PEZI|nr:uncharacterized protein BDZ99DRAFT_524823 [Mytilinidion resinicola]KAF2805105.1 hypothetical protein BDZ99DRAFT_524823 [Mytilinidion resinicola]